MYNGMQSSLLLLLVHREKEPVPIMVSYCRDSVIAWGGLQLLPPLISHMPLPSFGICHL